MGLVLVVCTGDQLVLHFYDHRYRAAAWMVGMLAVGLWHTMLYSTLSPAILALSKAHYNAVANILCYLYLFTLIPLEFRYYGMLGAVVAVAAGDLPVYSLVLYAAYRERVRHLVARSADDSRVCNDPCWCADLACSWRDLANNFREYVQVDFPLLI